MGFPFTDIVGKGSRGKANGLTMIFYFKLSVRVKLAIGLIWYTKAKTWHLMRFWGQYEYCGGHTNESGEIVDIMIW